MMAEHGQARRISLRERCLDKFKIRFSRSYWMFFCASFCMDLGFGLFLFLFNLYLTDLHFDERILGRMLACFTLGNVAGVIPGMFAARRYGPRPLLLFAFGIVPILSVLRIFLLSAPEQLALAFLSGAALCGWPICFSPVVAQLTSERNRDAGFSIPLATGIGVGTAAGIVGGYIPGFLHASVLHLSLVNGIRIMLLSACAVLAIGLWPISKVSLPRGEVGSGPPARIFHAYLLRFLPPFLLWNIVTGSLPVFGAIYLQRELGLPLDRLGAVFGASQLMQFFAVLGAPLLFKRTGIGSGISLAQLVTAALLVSLAEIRLVPVAACFYVIYFAVQFMCEPGIYQLLMQRIPERERSSASAIQNLTGALCQAGTAALTGICIVAYGYHTLLLANAAAALVAALLFACCGLETKRYDASYPGHEREIPAARDGTQDTEWMLEKAPE